MEKSNRVAVANIARHTSEIAKVDKALGTYEVEYDYLMGLVETLENKIQQHINYRHTLVEQIKLEEESI